MSDANLKLTIEAANQMACGLAEVSVDPIDHGLWRVDFSGGTEAHEPMTRAEWVRWLAGRFPPDGHIDLSDADIKTVLERIAVDELELTTLESRNSDDEDFHSLAVWEIATVMERAYRAGFEAGRKQQEGA